MTIIISDQLPDIYEKIKREIAIELNKAFPKVTAAITNDIRLSLVDLFQATDTYKALVDGPLDAHFGFPKGTSRQRVDQILFGLQEEVLVDFKPFKPNLSKVGGLTIKIARNDFEHILSFPAATVTTEKGEDLPWLDWLLKRGSEVIIEDYYIRFGKYSTKYSRSGKAIMKSAEGNFWKVPEQYAGVIGNNWITQTLDVTSPVLQKVLFTIVEANIVKIL